MSTTNNYPDSYWDGNYWRRSDGRFDEERNDIRPDEEKYKSKPFIMVAMILVLVGLIALLVHIFKSLPS